VDAEERQLPCSGLWLSKLNAILPHLGKLHAHASDAQDGGAMVADKPTREAYHDRRQGRQPRALRDLPTGRGRGVATDVHSHPVSDRPAAGGARAGMRGVAVESER
jgi:hypothetical protein